MVHLRLNETETNPNPHINFITALPGDATEQEEARQLLRALAAQVRPVMKAHGFVVNSFEEYEYNNVFAGRNWNNGETVELVLRRPNGAFYPIYWLMGTLCHELAHIKHMNHGPDFQKLWTRLKAEVRQLQDRGYYGDGYWSSGTRLRDSARVGGQGIEDGDFPEYMCGGAQTKTRPTAQRRRRRAGGKRRAVQPSLHTGAQTARKRKSGARVTSKYAFTGEGATLGAAGADGEGSTLVGTGFGKRAASKRARDERALAAEKRLQALLGAKTETKPSNDAGADGGGGGDSYSEDDDSEVEFVPETDAERRQALLASEREQGDEGAQAKLGSGAAWKSLKDDYNFAATPAASSSSSASRPGPGSGSGSGSGSKSGSKTTSASKVSGKGKSRAKTGGDMDIIEISSSDHESDSAASEHGEDDDAEAEEEPCDLPVASGSTFTSSSTPKVKGTSTTTTSSSSSTPLGLGLGRMAQTEMDLRRKEALGMAPVKGGGRTLGSAPAPADAKGTSSSSREGMRKTNRAKPLIMTEGRSLGNAAQKSEARAGARWACLVCTLENEPGHLACAACATPRGQQTFAGAG